MNTDPYGRGAAVWLKLTQGEADLLVGGALNMAISYAESLITEGGPPNDDDLDTLWKFQSIARKAQKVVGMPDKVLVDILASCYGTPAPAVAELLLAAQRRCGGRSS
jgi:hypothetical protein